MDDNGFQEFREAGDGEKRRTEDSVAVRKCCEEHLVLRGPRKPYFPAQPLEPYSCANLGSSVWPGPLIWPMLPFDGKLDYLWASIAHDQIRSASSLISSMATQTMTTTKSQTIQTSQLLHLVGSEDSRSRRQNDRRLLGLIIPRIEKVPCIPSPSSTLSTPLATHRFGKHNCLPTPAK